MSDSTREKRVVGRPFQPGNTGRPKGSRNKLGEGFLQNLHSLWERRGPEVLERLADEDPATLARMVASLLPKEVNVNHNAIDDLTDDDLDAAIADIRARLGRIEAAGDGSGTAH